jgi:hypothetical protein
MSLGLCWGQLLEVTEVGDTAPERWPELGRAGATVEGSLPWVPEVLPLTPEGLGLGSWRDYGCSLCVCWVWQGIPFSIPVLLRFQGRQVVSSARV